MYLLLRIIYQLLTAYLIFLVGWNLIKSKKKTDIILAAMVISIFILRVFLIK